MNAGHCEGDCEREEIPETAEASQGWTEGKGERQVCRGYGRRIAMEAGDADSRKRKLQIAVSKKRDRSE